MSERLTLREFINQEYMTHNKPIRRIIKELLNDGEDAEEVLGELIDVMENYDSEVNETL